MTIPIVSDAPQSSPRTHPLLETLTSTYIALAAQAGSGTGLQCLGSCALAAGSRAFRSQPLLWHRPRLLRSLSSGQLLAKTVALRGGSTAASVLEKAKVPLAFVGWYLMSIVYSLLNKEVLTVWKFPCIFSAVQLLVGTLWIGALWTPLPTLGLSKRRFAPVREPPRLSLAQLQQVSMVAIWLALGHVMSTVAPAYGTVAFTNVVKTLEPLFTCLFSAIFLKQVFALPVYLSLLPVIAGVAVASANEVSFSAISLISGLLSNVCFALRAITAKRLMTKPVGENMNAQNLYAVLTVISLAAILPFALAVEGRAIVPGTLATIEAVGLPRFLRMLLLAGVSHYTYNECAFLALSSIHPVTHAVANTIKRIAVIVVSVLYFQNPLTPTGAIGSAIAIVGVMLYSLAKASAPSPPAIVADKGLPTALAQRQPELRMRALHPYYPSRRARGRRKALKAS